MKQRWEPHGGDHLPLTACSLAQRPRVRHPLAAANQRQVAKRQTRRTAQLAQRHVLDERKNFARERFRVHRLGFAPSPFGSRALSLAHGCGSTLAAAPPWAGSVPAARRALSAEGPECARSLFCSTFWEAVVAVAALRRLDLCAACLAGCVAAAGAVGSAWWCSQRDPQLPVRTGRSPSVARLPRSSASTQVPAATFGSSSSGASIRRSATITLARARLDPAVASRASHFDYPSHDPSEIVGSS